MNSHDFIRHQVCQQLIKKGFKERDAYRAADDALEFYKRTAHFKRNALEECVRYATKRCKELAA